MQQDSYKDMPYIAKILHNIREVIAWDKEQKQPLILRINEAFIFKIARKAILEQDSTFLMSEILIEKLFNDITPALSIRYSLKFLIEYFGRIVIISAKEVCIILSI